jgi:hypothetical protein
MQNLQADNQRILQERWSDNMLKKMKKTLLIQEYRACRSQKFGDRTQGSNRNYAAMAGCNYRATTLSLVS